MADPFVTIPPSEVGPCTATWFIGADSGSSFNDSPTFGPSTSINPVGAWDFLVDGPLKDVLTTVYPSTDAFLAAWAAAGGRVDFTAQTALQAQLYNSSAHGYAQPLNGKGEWQMTNAALTAPEEKPYRWVVQFSVLHSIVR